MVAGRETENVEDIFKYELSGYPASLFDSSGLLREANKPLLADAIWTVSAITGWCSLDCWMRDRDAGIRRRRNVSCSRWLLTDPKNAMEKRHHILFHLPHLC